MNPLLQLKEYGQAVWLDNLSRTLIQDGHLTRLIEQDGLSGITSNPTIFYKAISESPYYREDLQRVKQSSADPDSRFESLAIPDIQAACDLMMPQFVATKGKHGYVSLEVSPRLALDEEGTVATAQRLVKEVQRANLLVKIPATAEGRRALERVIGMGINVNVTLMFSLNHVIEVAQAYMRGARQWVKSGGDPRKLKSVASVFLSRVDTLVDKKLEAIGSEESLKLRGKAAVSMSKLAYQRYKELFHGAAFSDLKSAGVLPQHLLWASTGTKNPQYHDLLYVEPLIGPETVNTMPDATLNAFRDHGKAALTLEQDVEEAQNVFLALDRLGIDMHAIGEALQAEGVKLFEDSYANLLRLVS